MVHDHELLCPLLDVHLLCAQGRVRVPKVVAMVITSLQLLQMVVGCAVNYFAFKFKESGRPCAVSDNNLFYSALMYFSYFVLFARFFYKAYFCKSERKSLEKGSTGESQLSGSPVSFGSVLQAGGKYSKDNNPLDKRSTEEESTEDSIVSTKETKETTNQAEEVKGVNLTEEKRPSALADNETDVVPSDKRLDPAEDEKENDIITNLKEKLNSQAQDEKGTIGSAQISEKAAPSEGKKTNRLRLLTKIQPPVMVQT